MRNQYKVLAEKYELVQEAPYADPEMQKLANKRYRLKSKDARNKYNREYRQNHPEFKIQQNQYMKGWRQKNKEHVHDYNKTYKATKREEIVIAAKQGNWRPWIEYRVTHKNSSAQQKNSWKWMVTVDYILKVWPKDNKCPILGTPFTLLEHKALLEHKGYNPNNPSIDRINASLDYIPGNVRVISLRANTIKNNGTAEEINTVAEWMKLNGATPDFI